MSTCSWGVSSRPLGRTPVSSGSLRAMPSSWFARPASSCVVAEAGRGPRARGRSRWTCPGRAPPAGSGRRPGRRGSGEKAPDGALGDGRGAVLPRRGGRPSRLQVDEGHARVLAGAGEAEAGDGEDGVDVGLLVGQEVVLDLLGDRQRARLRRARRQGELDRACAPWSSSGRKLVGRRRTARPAPRSARA